MIRRVAPRGEWGVGAAVHYHRRFVKRSLALLFCGALLLGSACSTKKGTLPAATVNGTPISTQALVDELNAMNSNPSYLDGLASGQEQNGQIVKGSKPGSFDASFARLVLQVQITNALIHQEVVRRGLHADDTCKQAAQKDVYATMPSAATSSDSGQSEFEAFPAAYQQTLLQRRTDLLVLEAALSGQPCVTGDAAHPDDFNQTCFSAILLADQASADAAAARVKGGEDFATVAKAVSQDQSAANGGDVGCVAKNQLDPSLVDAVFNTPVGQIAGPLTLPGSAIGGQDRFVIIKVTDHKQPQLEDVRQQAEELAALAVSNAINGFVSDAKKQAKVTVDSRYGTWNTSTGTIDAPPSASSSSSGAGAPSLSDLSSLSNLSDLPTTPDASTAPQPPPSS